MKTEVYSWRVEPELKAALERAARRRGASVGTILDEAARTWLGEHPDDSDEDEQMRIRAQAEATFGAFDSGESDRSTRVREIVRGRLNDGHGR